ncbi:MAG: hypothetical protein GXP60_02370 [Epsilonproteobacteria bacterium]|nr:hypothetical protein [Campylobacterota bacterium]
MRVESNMVNGIKDAFNNLNRAVNDINKDLAAKPNHNFVNKSGISKNNAPNMVTDTTKIIINRQQEDIDAAALKIDNRMKGSIMNIIA